MGWFEPNNGMVVPSEFGHNCIAIPLKQTWCYYWKSSEFCEIRSKLISSIIYMEIMFVVPTIRTIYVYEKNIMINLEPSTKSFNGVWIMHVAIIVGGVTLSRNPSFI